jgi:hypothetical protein
MMGQQGPLVRVHVRVMISEVRDGETAHFSLRPERRFLSRTRGSRKTNDSVCDRTGTQHVQERCTCVTSSRKTNVLHTLRQ